MRPNAGPPHARLSASFGGRALIFFKTDQDFNPCTIPAPTPLITPPRRRRETPLQTSSQADDIGWLVSPLVNRWGLAPPSSDKSPC